MDEKNTIMPKETYESLKEACAPLIQWYKENCGFMQSIVIDCDGLKVVNRLAFWPTSYLV